MPALGVQEHRLEFEIRPVGAGSETIQWIIYDVSLPRTMCNTWLRYFEDVDAIIFIAPISCFDEQLTEAPSINRLEDSLMFWGEICSAPLLSEVHLILLFSKYDLLEKKIKSGVSVNKSLPSFGERANEGRVVVKYLREKFTETLHRRSRTKRLLHLFSTSISEDVNVAEMTYNAVKDGILRTHLSRTKFFD